jgi:hypothetical protein
MITDKMQWKVMTELAVTNNDTFKLCKFLKRN